MATERRQQILLALLLVVLAVAGVPGVDLDVCRAVAGV